MKRLIEFPLEGQPGATVILEVDEPEAPGIARAARPDEVAERATDTFEAAVDKVTPAVQSLLEKVRHLASEPDEVSVEFGISFSAAAGAIIAKAGVEANFKLTLVWKREPA